MTLPSHQQVQSTQLQSGKDFGIQGHSNFAAPNSQGGNARRRYANVVSETRNAELKSSNSLSTNPISNPLHPTNTLPHVNNAQNSDNMITRNRTDSSDQ